MVKTGGGWSERSCSQDQLSRGIKSSDGRIQPDRPTNQATLELRNVIMIVRKWAMKLGHTLFDL